MRSLGVALGESAAAAARPLANTDGTADPAKTGIRPCLMKSRRLNMVAHLHQFSWNSGVDSTMNSRPAWFWECAAPLTKLSRVSSVELLIQAVPAGQPATFGG